MPRTITEQQRRKMAAGAERARKAAREKRAADWRTFRSWCREDARLTAAIRRAEDERDHERVAELRAERRQNMRRFVLPDGPDPTPRQVAA